MGKGRAAVKLETAQRRIECLRDLVNGAGEGSEGVYREAVQGLTALLAKADGPTIRWYFNQLMGSPLTTVELVVRDEHVFRALGDLLPKYLGTREACAELLTELKERVSEVVGGSV